MPPRFTKLGKDEVLVKEYIGGGMFSRNGVVNKGPPTLDDGNLFLTNKRLIFEYSDKNIAESTYHEDSIKANGNNMGFLGGGFLDIETSKIMDHNTNYQLMKAGDLANILNNNYYSVEGIRKRKAEEAKLPLKLASKAITEGGLENLQSALEIYNEFAPDAKKLIYEIERKIASEKEKLLDYDNAIHIYEELGLHDEAARVRKLVAEQKRVDQTVVHGDYVDDRDTIVKDSVINRSNIGSGGDDKFTKLKELTEMKEKGFIDDGEFKQMKKEILGK